MLVVPTAVRARAEQSKVFCHWIDSRIDGEETSSQLRFRLAGGCFDLAREHHNGVVQLISTGLFASALALMRPLYEAYVRGIWLFHCADENQLSDFVNGMTKPLDKMVREIEQHPEYGTGALSGTQARVKESFDHFVHSGFRAVVRRQTGDSIEAVYEEKEIVEVLEFADATGGLAAIEIAQLAKDEALALEILDLLQLGKNPGAVVAP